MRARCQSPKNLVILDNSSLKRARSMRISRSSWRMLVRPRSDRAAVGAQPVLGAQTGAILSQQRRFNAKNRVGLFLDQMRHWPDEARSQFVAHFFGQPPHLFMQRPVAELQIVINDQILNLP